MESFRRAQKYVGNRKQEIQLQKELEAIRNKAILEHLAKQHGMTTGLTEPATVLQAGDNVTTTARAPIPLSQPKSNPSLGQSTRKKVHTSQTLKQTHNVAHKRLGPQLSVSSKPITKPHHHKRQHQSTVAHQQQPPHSKESSPQKVVYDTSQNVKFAIASTLKTSAPVKYNKRDQPATVLPQKQHDELKGLDTHHVRKIEAHHVPSSGKTKSVPPLAESALYQDDIIPSSAGHERESQLPHSGYSSQHLSPAEKLDSLYSSSTDISRRTLSSIHSDLVLEEKHTHPLFVADKEEHETVTIHAQSGPLKLNIDLRIPSQDQLFSQLSQQSIDFNQRDEDTMTLASSDGGDQSSLRSMSSLSSVLTRITVESRANDHSEQEMFDSQSELGSENQSVGSKSTLAFSSISSLGQDQINAAHSHTELLGSDDKQNKYDNQSRSLTSVKSISTLSSQPRDRLQLSAVDLSAFPSHDSPSETNSFQLGLDKGVIPSVSVLDVHSEVVLEEEQVNVVSTPTAQSAPAFIATNQHQGTVLLDSQSPHQLETVPESDTQASTQNSNHSTLKALSSTITDDGSSTPLSDEISSVGLPPFSLPSQRQSFGTPSSQNSTLSQPFSTPSISSPPQHSVGDVETSFAGIVMDRKYGTASENYISTSSWLMSMNATVQENTTEDTQVVVKSNKEYENDRTSIDSHLSASQRENDLESASPSENVSQEFVMDKRFTEMSSTDVYKGIDLSSVSGSLSEMDGPDITTCNVESREPDIELQLGEQQVLVDKWKVHSEQDNEIEDGASFVSVSEDNETHLDDDGGIPDNLAEYLAYSDKPLTLEDILNVSGKSVERPSTTAGRSLQPFNKKSSLFPSSTTDGPRSNLEYQNSVKFLSTWTTNQSSRPTIHHFCTTDESLHPHLPLPLQLLSRMTHTKSDITISGQVVPSPPSSPRSKQIVIPSSTINKHSPMTRESETIKSYTSVKALPAYATRTGKSRSSKKPSQESSAIHSSTFLSTPKPAPHGSRDEDVIIAAKRRLQREMKASSSSTQDNYKRRKIMKRVLTPDVESRQRHSLRPATTGSNVERGDLSVSGDRMVVVKDPSNLLWTPAPPKLSLYPSTIQTHLFPAYHAQSTMGVSLGRESYLLPGQQSDIASENNKSPKPRVYNPAVHSVPNFSSLKPLVTTTSSTSNTHSSHTLTSDRGDDTHLNVPLSSQNDPSLTSSDKISDNQQMHTSSSTKPAQEISDKVSILSRSSSQSSDVPTINEGQSIQEQQLSRLMPSSLSARRNTVNARGSGMVEMFSSHGLMIEEEEDGGNDEQRSIEQEQESVVLSAQSLPLLPLATGELGERIVKMSEDFNSVMNEIKWQRERVVEVHREQEELLKQQQQQANSEEDELQTDELIPLEGSVLATSGAFTSRRLQRQAMRGTRKAGSTLGRVKAIRRSRSAQMRAQKARELISQPPRQLTRSVSFPLIAGEDFTVHYQPSVDYRKSKRLSLPCLNEESFISLMSSQGAQPASDGHYKWAYDVWWERWFPEVLKECREAVAGLYSRVPTAVQRPTKHLQTQLYEDINDKDARKDDCPKEKMKVISLLDVSPLPGLSTQQVQDCESKLAVLSRDISSCRDDCMLAVFLCRRGALLRKVGRLTDSMADLNRSLSLLPSLSDVYWHRHLLYLVTGDTRQALSDLTSLLKLNKKHYGAYRSRAMLFTHGHFQHPNQGVVGGVSSSKDRDVAKAIYDLSQAITMEPVAETYFMRAELHEIRGEVESAVSDYARLTELDPSNLEALNRQALHKFKKGMWAAATKHFDMLLKQDPNNTGARIHRAKAQYNMNCYVEALQDLSAAIHLDPNNAQAFYHRACLLRSKQPQQALRDFSISLLLDDSKENVSSFIHRGVLYTQMKCYEEALCDFEAAINLQQTLPSPHVCAGLIHMLHLRNLPRAVRFFSGAIMVDPTFVRAYLCRAEAYKKDEKYSKAILDYTRALHFEPNNPRHFLLKGELYLHLGQNDLASLHIKIASKLSTGLEQSKTQRALVESFLGNHEEAVTLLKGQLKTPDICTLLGKVQMKAELFGEAAESFRQAAALVDRARKPSYLVARMSELGKPDKDSVTIKAQSNIHFLCGRSLMENRAWKEAVDEFSTVLELQPRHEMAYFERGVAKLKAGNSRGVLDLNKALALNPQLHQAFLARAAYYGRSGRYSKAILNCNEALRLEPKSVRAYLCRGSLKYRTKLYHGAIDDFTTAISMDPAHSSLAHFNRALCYQAIGHLDKALSDYSVVLLLQNSPKFKVLVNRGLLYLQLKDHTNALFDFTQAGTLVQDDPNILQAIGHCYHQLGSLDSAIDAYSEAIRLEPNFVGAFVGRGNVYMDYLTAESFNNCKADYQYSLYIDPHCLPAKINLAFLYQAEGKFQQAWNELTSALREEPHCMPALEARAVISLQMGNLFGALLDINAAINISKTAILLTNRGVVHQYMGDVVSAMRDYEEAVKIDHTYFLAHFNAGNVHFQQRHFKQAVTSYTQALSTSLTPDHSILVNRAIAHVMLHHTQVALEDFNGAIDNNPYSAHAHFNRANLYRSMGDYTLAEMDYKKALELDPDDWLTMYYHGEVLGKLGHMDQSHQTFQKAAQTETK